LPGGPVPLDDVRLVWADGPAGVEVTGTEPEARGVLPLRAPGRRFDRYTAAMRALARPALFEDRPSYRLLDADLADRPRLAFGTGTYFDKLDTAEAVAHELARTGGRGEFRELIGDPFDLRRRAVLPAIDTLTLRRRKDGRASFLLHWRDPAKVATTAGIYGLVPTGEFQPVRAASWEADLDLWRTIVREYAEEVLGRPEPDAAPVDYDDWPLFRDLRQARDDGRVRAYCVGLGLDALTLTLTATILTVVVIDDDLFDQLFGAAVRVNAEGVAVTAAGGCGGVPFTEQYVDRMLTVEPMASQGACTLARAWRFRGDLLSYS
jgi:hypothetical protein